jgi:hypothetical protein
MDVDQGDDEFLDNLRAISGIGKQKKKKRVNLLCNFFEVLLPN